MNQHEYAMLLFIPNLSNAMARQPLNIISRQAHDGNESQRVFTAKADIKKLDLEKSSFHPRNKHSGRYNFDQLIQASPELVSYVKVNAFNDASINFANPQAVKALNRALLKQYYNLVNWNIPAQYLCPPIPGRADYLHYIADLLGIANDGVIPRGGSIRVLDVGVGANIIYPLIGFREYGWHFVGVDIDRIALKNAQHILNINNGMSEAIELRLQDSPSSIFNGVIGREELFDLTICNPPFHISLGDAALGTRRKWKNLGKSASGSEGEVLNFGGQATELCCIGGELAFVSRMIIESESFAKRCFWFTTLVSKASNLPGIYRLLKKVNAVEVKTINMVHGQKKSRIVAWTFLNVNQQRCWYSSKKIKDSLNN